MDDAAGAIDRQTHRIDEERHVVIGDLDDRVRRQPAISQRVGVVNANLRLALAAPLGEAPQRKCRATKVARAAPDDVARRHVLVKFANDAHRLSPLGHIDHFGGERRRLFYRRQALCFASAPGSGARRCNLIRCHSASLWTETLAPLGRCSKPDGAPKPRV